MAPEENRAKLRRYRNEHDSLQLQMLSLTKKIDRFFSRVYASRSIPSPSELQTPSSPLYVVASVWRSAARQRQVFLGLPQSDEEPNSGLVVWFTVGVYVVLPGVAVFSGVFRGVVV